MTCILKKCPHPGSDKRPSACCSLAAADLGECGAAYALALSRRNDGYLVLARNNPTIDGLLAAGLVFAKAAGDGCLIIRAIVNESRPRPVTIGYRGNRLASDHRARWTGAVA